MQVVDVHAHVFHPKIAHKAVTQLNDYYRITPFGDGSPDDLLACQQRADICLSVVHSAATAPHQVRPANDWAIHLQNTYPAIEAFGTIHPGLEGWKDELQRLADNGIRGIKLHPEFMDLWLDDPRLEPVYQECCGRFIMMFHVGDDKPPHENHSCPYKIAQIKRNFPGLAMIAAHLGGFRHWEHVARALKGLEVYIDSSSSLEVISDDDLRTVLAAVPPHLWLFGSDYPLNNPAREMELLAKRCGFSDTEMAGVLAGNWQELTKPYQEGVRRWI